MKNFVSWGIRVRKDLPRNYYSVWENLKTTRLDLGDIKPLETKAREFYDCGITSICHGGCRWCYVSADPRGEHYKDICGVWKRWMDTFPEDKKINPSEDPIFKDILSRPSKDATTEELEFQFLTGLMWKRGLPAVYTEKPYQIAIGSVGEPTEHPDLPKFLQTVYETKVVPNYTTNGVLLSDESKAAEILEATKNFCGGVAVSYGNKALRGFADKAIHNLLLHGECKVMIHEIIKDKASVDDFLEVDKKYGQDIHYHVLLPLMAHGRSKESMDMDTYLYLTEKIKEKGMTNIAFGANFLPFMEKNPGSVNVYEYPSEVYSANILLKGGEVVITPSSFNLEPIEKFRP